MMPHGGMMGGTGAGSMWQMMLFGGLHWLVLAGLIFLGVRYVIRLPRHGDAAEILKRRLANGEVSAEEYKEKIALLRQHP